MGANTIDTTSPLIHKSNAGAVPPLDPRPPWLASLYPFASHYLDVPGGRMHYVDEGSGPPIVMLHGNPTWSFYYRDLIKALSERYRVIVPDHIGCGLSDKPAEYPYTLSTHIENVTRLMDSLNLGDVSLAVHDWGGAIGFGWAVGHIEQVRRLIVFNTAAFIGGPMPFRIRVCRWPIVDGVGVVRLNAFARAAIHMACCKKERMTAQVRAGYLWPYDTPAHRVAISSFVRDIPVSPRVPSYRVIEDIQNRLSGLIDVPMLIMWGMKDFCFTEWFLDEWIERFPKAAVHRFAGAGHYVVEDANELILPLIQDFMTKPK